MQNNTQTYVQQTLPLGGNESMYSPEASPANPSASPESAKVQKMSATCGPKCCEQFSRFNHVGLWAKTFSALLVGRKGWSSSRCALIWRLRATKSRRLYFQLAVSELRTDDTELGLLPTLTAIDMGSGRINKSQSPGATPRPSIAQMASHGLLPTPTTSDHKPGYSPVGLTRSDGKSRIDSLRCIPAMTFEHCTQRSGKTSQLNPLFVAEMMGFPPDWTLLPFLSESQNPENLSPFQNGEPKASKPTETQ